MNTTFLLAVFFSMICAVGLSGLVVYLFAEARWNQHPMARCTQQRASSFASSY